MGFAPRGAGSAGGRRGTVGDGRVRVAGIDQRLDLIRWHRPTQKKALILVTMQRFQQLALTGGFNALNGHLHVHLVAENDDGFDNFPVAVSVKLVALEKHPVDP